jgi:hypothetical protein
MNNTQNIKKLIELATKYPELPIVAMVDGELVGDDDYCYWLGEFGNVEYGEYALYGDRYFTEREGFKEEFYDYHDDKLCEKFGYEPGINDFTLKNGHCTREQFEKNKENEKALEEYLDGVAERAFNEAIIVYINTPDNINTFDETVC